MSRFINSMSPGFRRCVEDRIRSWLYGQGCDEVKASEIIEHLPHRDIIAGGPGEFLTHDMVNKYIKEKHLCQ